MFRQLISAAARVIIASVLTYALTAPAFARNNAYWHGISSMSWNDGSEIGNSNWYSQAPPNGSPVRVPKRNAFFAPGAVVQNVFFNRPITSIETILFLRDVETYLFTLSGKTLNIAGRGIINQAMTTPTFVVNADSTMRFQNSAAISGKGRGDNIVIKNSETGRTLFKDSSKGGRSLLSNEGNGRVIFFNTSSAENMSLRNLAGSSGSIIFLDNSDPSNAEFVNSSGSIDIAKTRGPTNNDALTARSVQNDDRLSIGHNTLSISKRLNLTGGSRLIISLDKNKAGRIFVTKGMNLAGDLRLNGDGTAKHTRYVLLQASGGRKGRFKTVAFSAGLQARNPKITYRPDRVILDLDPPPAN